jgi:SPOR domain
MTSTTARRSRVAAQKQAAKQKRQVYMVAGLCVLLVGMLGLELPKILKSSTSSAPAASSAPVVAPVAAPAAQAAKPSAALRAVLKQPARDVFAQTRVGSPTTLGSVATPPGLHDPFAQPSTSEAAVAPVVATTAPKIPLLPGTIVLGTPGAGKVADSGWIVILASIPTAAGQSSATSFAKQAEKAGIGSTSVLNSSNRRPLRGGYWVVYTGPYNSLTEVSAAADNVHKSGFSSAYIRELVVYKAKPAAKPTSKKKKK